MRRSILCTAGVLAALLLPAAAHASTSVRGAGSVILDGRGDPQYEGDRIDLRVHARDDGRGALRVTHNHGRVAMHLYTRVDCVKRQGDVATVSGPIVRSRWSGPREEWGEPFPDGFRFTLWLRDQGRSDALGFGFMRAEEPNPCDGDVPPSDVMLPVRFGDFGVRSR